MLLMGRHIVFSIKPLRLNLICCCRAVHPGISECVWPMDNTAPPPSLVGATLPSSVWIEYSRDASLQKAQGRYQSRLELSEVDRTVLTLAGGDR